MHRQNGIVEMPINIDKVQILTLLLKRETIQDNPSFPCKISNALHINQHIVGLKLPRILN